VQQRLKIGRYVLIKLIGEGGMGQVWKAHDPVIKRTVALKVLLPKHAADEQYRTRFLREPQLAGNLKHPNIVVVYDAGAENGDPYLAMEWIDGTDLGKLVAEGPLAPRRAVRILGQIASALDTAHKNRLVHRDVKPNNILVSKSTPETAHLIDFGIGKEIEATTDSGKTDGVIGTRQYVAPERITAAMNGEEDRPHTGVDVYSLACVMYEALTGQMAFPTGNLADTAGNRRLPKATEANPKLPMACNGVLERGFATDPQARFTTAGQLVDAVEDVLNRHDQLTAWERGRPLTQPRAAAAQTAGGDGNGEAPTNSKLKKPQPETPRPKPQTRQMTARAAAHRRPLWGRWILAIVAAGGLTGWFLWTAGNGDAPTPPPADIAVGTAPHAIAVDSTGKLALVAETGSDAVGVVDLTRRTVVASIRVGDEPEAVALSADNSTAYVPNRGTNTLSMIDVAKRSVLASIPVGDGPVDVALSRDGRRAYVSNADAGSVSIVDTARRAVVGEVDVAPFWGDTLGGLAVSPDGSRVLVSATRQWFEDRVFEIDTAKEEVASSVRAGEAPQGIVFSHDGRYAYVANSGSNTMSVIDVINRAEITAIPVGREPQKVVLSPDGRLAYVTSPRSDTVTVIDLTTNVVTQTLSVDGGPIDLAPGADGQAYVVKQNSGDLTTYSLNG